VGIDLGPILLGTIGAERRSERAIIGAPLKLAEQLEALSKKGKTTRIIASQAFAKEFPASRFRRVDENEAFELSTLD